MPVEQQMRDAQAVVRGDKPLAIIEQRKAPGTYDQWSQIYARVISTKSDTYRKAYVYQRVGEEGNEILVARTRAIYLDYLSLLADRWMHARKEFQALMGAVLGYDSSDNYAWYLDPTSMRCECSKCGGTVTPQDRLDHVAWLAEHGVTENEVTNG